MLAEIRGMARDNKDQIEGVRREMAVMARQSNKHTVIKSTTPVPELDTEALNTLRGDLFELQNEQEKVAHDSKRRQAELLDDLSRKQVDVNLFFSL